MKKTLLGVVVLATALSGCAKSEVPEMPEQQDGIGFATYVSLPTAPAAKGVPVADNNAFNTAGVTFDVTAFIDDLDQTYFDGITIKKGTSWEYDTPAESKFWPSSADQTLDFFAYHNAPTGLAVTQAGGMTLTGHEVSETVDDQADFMYAAVPNAHNDLNSTECTDVTSGTLALYFRHAFTQIRFTAEVATGYSLEIEKVAIYNIKSKADFTLAADKNTNTTTADLGAWDFGTYTEKATYTASHSGVATPIVSTASVPTPITITGGHELLLLPQTFTGWSGSGAVNTTDPYILVSCRLYDADDVYYIGSDSDYQDVAISFSSTADDASTGIVTTAPEWQAGRCITYNLAFGDPNSGTGGGGKDPETGENVLVPIKFSATTGGWNYIGTSTDVEF